jgi:hypothetical protein
MAYTQQQAKQSAMMATSSEQLKELIAAAIKKIGGKKENDLCRYLPMNSGGYMHHFTLKKMMHQLPEKLSEMIKTFITEADKPVTIPPKQRAARGSRKKKDQVILSKNDVEYILQMARSIGDKEIVRKLMPRKDLRAVKKELISSIKNGRIEQELWNCYVEMTAHAAPAV